MTEEIEMPYVSFIEVPDPLVYEPIDLTSVPRQLLVDVVNDLYFLLFEQGEWSDGKNISDKERLHADALGKYLDPIEVDTKRLSGTTDAQVWAEEFKKVRPDVDEGLMLGWFANAIETARTIQKNIDLDERANDPSV